MLSAHGTLDRLAASLDPPRVEGAARAEGLGSSLGCGGDQIGAQLGPAEHGSRSESESSDGCLDVLDA
jgi:hypothetical protein